VVLIEGLGLSAKKRGREQRGEGGDTAGEVKRRQRAALCCSIQYANIMMFYAIR